MEKLNYIIAFDENGQPYMAHHGIKGQKWGVRRSPEELGHPKSSKSGLADEVKQKLKSAARVGLAAGGIALIAYGGYKLNDISVQSLRRNDLKAASEWLQTSNILTEQVDEYFHDSIRRQNILIDGESVGKIAGERARLAAKEARNAINQYKYYADRAADANYSTSERIDEIKRLLNN